MRKKFLAVSLAIAMTCGLVGCGEAVDNKTDNGTNVAVSATDNDIPENSINGEDTGNGSENGQGESGSTENVATGNESTAVSEVQEPVEKTWYDEMIEKSLLAKGNNYRLKKVIEKARSGETVNLAILGGSITEGAGATTNDKGYAYQFADAFKDTYCTGELNFVNAGLSGTPSALGVMRYEKDVIEPLGCDPDLLIIEFAVNDWEECTGGRALESLIYQALSANENSAVILLFSVSQGKWNLQDNMALYGRHYGIPMVSIKDAITSTTEVPDATFFSDEYHPKTYGHTVMSDCLMYLLATVDAAKENNQLMVPDLAKKGRNFVDMQLIYEDTPDVKVEIGGFGEKDTNVQTCYFTKKICFPDNYMKGTDNGGPLKVTLECSSFLLDFKTANDSSFGKADILVDGQVVMTVDGNSPSGWNNNSVVLVIDEKEVAQHTVEVRMAAGSENKKFTVLAMAFN